MENAVPDCLVLKIEEYDYETNELDSTIFVWTWHKNCNVAVVVPVVCCLTGRSSKTSAIVIAAKMRARRRRKCFPHETGWRENGCAGASVVLLTSVKTFADEKQICWRRKSSDEICLKNKICWQQKSADEICWRKQNLLTRNIFWQNLLKKRKSSGHGKLLKNMNTFNKVFATKMCVIKR